MAVNGILGKKVGMAQLFDDKGDVRPVTVLQAGPCVVTQRKTVTKDGYDAAQIGLVEFVKESRLTGPMKGHFAKNNLPPMRFLREVTVVIESEGQEAAKVGDKVLVDMFDGRAVRGCDCDQQGPRLRRRGKASQVCRWRCIARLDVPDHRFDWFVGLPFASL